MEKSDKNSRYPLPENNYSTESDSSNRSEQWDSDSNSTQTGTKSDPGSNSRNELLQFALGSKECRPSHVSDTNSDSNKKTYPPTESPSKSKDTKKDSKSSRKNKDKDYRSFCRSKKSCGQDTRYMIFFLLLIIILVIIVFLPGVDRRLQKYVDNENYRLFTKALILLLILFIFGALLFAFRGKGKGRRKCK